MKKYSYVDLKRVGRQIEYNKSALIEIENQIIQLEGSQHPELYRLLTKRADCLTALSVYKRLYKRIVDKVGVPHVNICPSV